MIGKVAEAGLLRLQTHAARWTSRGIRERAGRVWRLALALVGLVLLFYREGSGRTTGAVRAAARGARLRSRSDAAAPRGTSQPSGR